ncbi:MAG: dTMP kinase [Chloroflexi bacterium]|nr:dTMP kinase [Chloroflexota bacterium]MDA1146795.1 dTMP kinase [Chloroflexota bacterium]MQC82410.1 dTMP kinase [Chloroflexota bacterium]PKB56686.1 MAG: dTMP kinase [SAR202 cluster bacterium Casp-Chloro-G1]
MPSEAPRHARGWFVTLEGGEGAGKSTQLAALAERARALGIETVTTREPGGTALGERLRSALLTSADGETDERAELLVFAASRAQLVAELIRPALDRGALVICDRFADSTVAYQQYGRGLPADVVAAAIAIATDGLTPDLTVLLDLEPAVGHARRAGADDYLERAEGGFHERVRAGFAALAAAGPERWLVLDGTLPASEVTERVWARLHGDLEGRGLA